MLSPMVLLGLVGFGGQGTKIGAANSLVEQSIGAILQKPVLQCGTGSDAVTDDGIAGSVTGFENGPARPIALSADGTRLFVTNRLHTLWDRVPGSWCWPPLARRLPHRPARAVQCCVRYIYSQIKIREKNSGHADAIADHPSL